MRSSRVASVVIIVATLLLVGCAVATPSDSGIRGQVTVGPSGAVRSQGASGTQPYAADLVIKPQGGRSAVARVTSGADGRFSVTLKPGTYVIRASSAQVSPSLAPVVVVVEAHRFTEAVVPFDDGTR